MSSLMPSSPEPSKWTATKVIPASANRSHSARIAALAAACSGGSACSELDGLFSMGFFFQLRELGCSLEPQAQDRDFTFYFTPANQPFAPHSPHPSEQHSTP